MSQGISRRDWMRHCAHTGTTTALAGAIPSISPAAQTAAPSEYRNYFGDLHNHNQVGYAQGTLQRTFEIARNHLDFFAFTPHSYWPDVGEYDGRIEHKWKNGFAVAKARWPDVVKLAREFDDPGQFTTILGYERHGTMEGDYHILFPDLKGDYELIEKLADLQAFARKRGCILVPHHPANRLGHRGIASASINTEISPVLEIHSEWGCAEHDRAPQPYKRHTEGGRWTRHTLQHYLNEGHRLGVIASTDDHLGFPGGYREGLAAVKVHELSREAIFDAIKNRRTYAVTGDRIELDFFLNGSMMGQSIPYTRDREIHASVNGWDQIDRVEVVKNGRVIHRDFPVDKLPAGNIWDKPVVIRFEYGWGPWPALGWGGTADWDFVLEVKGGRIKGFHPCFTSGPLDEFRRDRIVNHDEHSVHVQSHTALKQQIDDYSQKALVLRIQGDASTKIVVNCTKPRKCSITQSFAELSESNEMLFTAPFPWESAMLHRVVYHDNWSTSFGAEDEGDGAHTDWYYLRVFQSNGEMAWSSPIWVESS